MLTNLKNFFSKKDDTNTKKDNDTIWQQEVLTHLTALEQLFATNASVLQTDLRQDVTAIISDLNRDKNLGMAGRLNVKRLLTRIGRHEYDHIITLTPQEKEHIASLLEINTNGDTGVPGGLTRF